MMPQFRPSLPNLEALPHRSAKEGRILIYRQGSGNEYEPLSSAIADESITSRMFAPTVIEQRCTTDTTTSGTTETDLTGASISVTPAIASIAIVWGQFLVNGNTGGDVFVGLLDVDGTNQPSSAAFVNHAVGYYDTMSHVWVVPLTAAAHTLKLQLQRSSGTGTATATATTSKMVLFLMGDANVTNDTNS